MKNALRIVVSDGTAGGCEVDLLPGWAAFLPSSSTLLAADVHLGKAATFRRAGLPVPEGSAQRDLERLAALMAATAAKRLLILGDLFHAASGCTPRVFEEFAAFRASVARAEVVLVLGNHDRRVRVPATLGIDRIEPEIVEGRLRFLHDSVDAGIAPSGGTDAGITFCGHLHPRLAIRSPSGGRCTERCFVEHAGLFVLPAFGTFTGTHPVQPADRMRLWAAGLDAVVDVTRMAMLVS